MADAHDLTTAKQLDLWILGDINFGTDRGAEPDAPETERIRDHHIITRYRFLKAPFDYDPPVGDELNGIGVEYWTGDHRAETDPELAWRCTYARIELLEPGSDILRETQTWDYIGAWGDY